MGRRKPHHNPAGGHRAYPGLTLNKLYESGRNAAQEFLATWSFEDYIGEFRGGRKAPDRRVETGVLMRENAKARSSVHSAGAGAGGDAGASQTGSTPGMGGMGPTAG